MRTSRKGFTLIELLVVIAIIAILIGMLLPAVQKVRESAGKASCQNNLKQLVIALHAYHDENGHLPSSIDAKTFSAFAHLLPYIEQKPLYDRIDFSVSYSNAANAAVRGSYIKSLICPSDPKQLAPTGFAPTSYRTNSGSGILNGLPSTNPSNSNYNFAPPNGPMYTRSQVMLSHITDGTSQTAAFSEHLIGDFDNTKSSPSDTFKPGTYPSTPDQAMADCNAVNTTDLSKQGVSAVGAPWLQGYHSTSIYFHVMPPGGRSCMFPPGRIGTAANANHGGFVMVGLCDGSVRPVSYSISIASWRAVGTIAENDVVGNDW